MATIGITRSALMSNILLISPCGATPKRSKLAENVQSVSSSAQQLEAYRASKAELNEEIIINTSRQTLANALKAVKTQCDKLAHYGGEDSKKLAILFKNIETLKMQLSARPPESFASSESRNGKIRLLEKAREIFDRLPDEVKHKLHTLPGDAPPEPAVHYPYQDSKLIIERGKRIDQQFVAKAEVLRKNPFIGAEVTEFTEISVEHRDLLLREFAAVKTSLAQLDLEDESRSGLLAHKRLIQATLTPGRKRLERVSENVVRNIIFQRDG